MNWWGKVLGGAFGWMMGGPLGAILGAAVGNYFDNGLAGAGKDSSLGLGATQRVQTVFFTTTFSVMGYVAKIDGRVSRDEIELAEQVMDQMQLNTDQRQVAKNLFREGKAPGFPIHQVLAQFRRECFRRRNLIQMFMEIQVATAMSDGNLDAAEKRMLGAMAVELGFSRVEFDTLVSRLSSQAGFASEEDRDQKLKSAYGLLGINESASDDELKRAYRRLMSQHHPDKLVARGLPEEMIEVATDKTREIKSAYELIKESRT